MLAELAQLNTAMPPLALRIMDGSAGTAEQGHFALRLIAAGERLQRRADALREVVVEGEVVATGLLGLPADTVKPDLEQ